MPYLERMIKAHESRPDLFPPGEGMLVNMDIRHDDWCPVLTQPDKVAARLPRGLRVQSGHLVRVKRQALCRQPESRPRHQDWGAVQEKEEGISVMDNEFTTHDLTKEEWREYEFGDDERQRTYRIQSPSVLYLRNGGSTHRILDAAGTVHCVPAVGFHGCVLRWKPRDANEPVQF